MSFCGSLLHGPIRKDPLLSIPDMRIREQNNEYDGEIEQDAKMQKITTATRKSETTRKHRKFQIDKVNSILLSYTFLFLKL
jgi:hypothetical protein